MTWIAALCSYYAVASILTNSVLAVSSAVAQEIAANRFPLPIAPITALEPQRPREPIRVGLLIAPQTTGTHAAEAAQRAARLALTNANSMAGQTGARFELIVRAMEGPWGSGSKEVVRLVHDDSVAAILGALDGRSAHIAEQVVAKARVPLVTTRATDPTITQAYVPWIFRCVPNDLQQAEALVSEIFERRGLRHVATLAASTYDSHTAAATFTKLVTKSGHTIAVELPLMDSAETSSSLITALQQSTVDAIVLFGQADAGPAFLKQARAHGLQQPVFGPLWWAAGQRLDPEHTVVIVAPTRWFTDATTDFADAYQLMYGSPPPLQAAYVYDGMRLIIESVRAAGHDHDRIRDALASIDHEGVTGRVRFDQHGNRMHAAELVELGRGQARPIP